MGFMERFRRRAEATAASRLPSCLRSTKWCFPHGGSASTRGQSRQHGVSLDMHPAQATRQISSSIISAGGTFGAGTRLQRVAPAATRRQWLAASLPLIGNKTVPEQQRILGGVVLLGFARPGAWAPCWLSAASRGANQVAAVGQALMQSQRLAKSVSQALVGSAQAFPEVRDCVDRAGHQRARLAQWRG